jgi:hypothetical protein
VEEVLNYFEGLLLVDVGKHLVELFEIRSHKVELLVAVETAHLGALLVDGLSRVDIGHRGPNLGLGFLGGEKCLARVSAVLGQI